MSLGQFCAVARAIDLLGERWTLLVVRELLAGSRGFAEIRRGIPRVSKTMLAQRLRGLVDAGVVVRNPDGYALTDAGRELAPLVGALGTWGQRWLPRTLPDDELDADVLVWDMRRRVELAALPPAPVVVRLELADVHERRYLLLRREEVSLCTENPGFPEEVVVRAPRRTLVGWWRGDLDLAGARRAGLTVTGRRDLVRAFPTWFARYAFAETPAHASLRRHSSAARPSSRARRDGFLIR